jgi:hypothetical protein
VRSTKAIHPRAPGRSQARTPERAARRRSIMTATFTLFGAKGSGSAAETALALPAIRR